MSHLFFYLSVTFGSFDILLPNDIITFSWPMNLYLTGISNPYPTCMYNRFPATLHRSFEFGSFDLKTSRSISTIIVEYAQ